VKRHPAVKTPSDPPRRVVIDRELSATVRWSEHVRPVLLDVFGGNLAGVERTTDRETGAIVFQRASQPMTTERQ
jgi:hypothetical protein